MDWIKIKVSHILFNELTDAEVGQFVRAQALVAFKERLLTKSEEISVFSQKKKEKVETFLKENDKVSLKFVYEKVLEDVEEVLENRKFWRDKKRNQRDKTKQKVTDLEENVPRDVSGDVPGDVPDIDKLSIDNIIITPTPTSSSCEDSVGSESQQQQQDFDLKASLAQIQAGMDIAGFFQLHPAAMKRLVRGVAEKFVDRQIRLGDTPKKDRLNWIQKTETDLRGSISIANGFFTNAIEQVLAEIAHEAEQKRIAEENARLMAAQQEQSRLEAHRQIEIAQAQSALISEFKKLSVIRKQELYEEMIEKFSSENGSVSALEAFKSQLQKFPSNEFNNKYVLPYLEQVFKPGDVSNLVMVDFSRSEPND